MRDARVSELVSGATIVLMPVMRTIMISLITFHRLAAINANRQTEADEQMEEHNLVGKAKLPYKTLPRETLHRTQASFISS